jgi:YVTN family beta-propeller protein
MVTDDIYDSGRGEVFIANTYEYSTCSPSCLASNVSVLSDASNSVVANVSLETPVSSMTYDSGTGQIFAAGGTSVTVISDRTDQIVAVVPVGSAPTALSWDAQMGEVFVVNENTNNVSVINTTRDAVVADIPVGQGPTGAAFDSGRDDLFVANYDSFNVSVISGATNTVVATVGLADHPGPIVYDSGTGQVFVSVGGNISVISDVNDQIVDTVPVSFTPEALTYDAGSAELFAADTDSNNVTIISDASHEVAASIPIAAPETLSYAEGWGVVLVTSASGVGVSVINDSTNSVVATILPDTSLEFPVYDAGGKALFVVSGFFGTDAPVQVIRVPLQLSVGAAASSTYAESTVITSFTALAVGGEWSYSSWSWSFGDGGTSSQQDPSHTYEATGSYRATVVVTQSGGGTAVSNSVLIQVPALLSPLDVQLALSNSSPALGQSIAVQATASGGAGPYSYTYSGLPPGCVSVNESTIGCLPTQSGSYNLTATVLDENRATASANATLDVIFAFTASAAASTPLGRALTIRVDVESPAVGTITYSYSGLPPGCSNADAANLTCTPTRPGTYPIVVEVHDQAGDQASRTIVVDVVSPGQSSGPLGLSGSSGYYALVGTVVAVAVALAAVRTISGRRHAGPSAHEGKLEAERPYRQAVVDPPELGQVKLLKDGEEDPASDLY